MVRRNENEVGLIEISSIVRDLMSFYCNILMLMLFFYIECIIVGLEVFGNFC